MKDRTNKRVYEHDFVNGICQKCDVKQGEEVMNLCPVIGIEEVREFRDYDER